MRAMFEFFSDHTDEKGQFKIHAIHKNGRKTAERLESVGCLVLTRHKTTWSGKATGAGIPTSKGLMVRQQGETFLVTDKGGAKKVPPLRLLPADY